ncbi:MAG: fructose bisphosphate aldolase [Gammaproteobacteria bacterium]|nr:fructose bisphosphate aldolase [Gammaproteobacteria bacterium]
MKSREEQKEKIRSADGFIAALDQSGGSTPKALNLYGIESNSWKDEEEMFDLVHKMRSRIISSSSFSGTKILGAILFEQTMEREVQGSSTTDYLWKEKKIVPFLKVDRGLTDEVAGMQPMKPIDDLNETLDKAASHGVFGTKMRSVVHKADAGGIEEIVLQQFEIGRQILLSDLTPIIEPEIDIHCVEKRRAEDMIKDSILRALDNLEIGEVVLKLTLPELDDFYIQLVDHPRVLRVVALSGGYSRQEANKRLLKQKGMVASFSRALTEGLTAGLNEQQFDNKLSNAIQSIFEASVG